MIKILCVGKIKERYLDDLIKDYATRLSKYVKLEIIEIKDNVNYDKEIASIKDKINPSDYNIALAIDGQMLTSQELSTKIENIWQTNSNITFIIGGSLGLNNEIFDMVNEKISFSKMTFPHGLFRGILLEQLYRSFKIMNNEAYHK